MVNGLTWRDVAAPNFFGVNEGMRVAGNALNNAFTGFSDSLGKFQTFNQDQAAGQAWENALKFQDPAAYKAALANGTILSGINPSFLTPDALKGLNDRATTLLSQATSQQSLDHNAVMNPLLEQHQRNENTYDASANPIRIDQLKANLTHQQQTNEQSKTKFDQDQSVLEDQQQARAALADITKGATSLDDIKRGIETSKLTADQKFEAYKMLNAAGAAIPGIGGSPAVPSAGPGAGNASAAIAGAAGAAGAGGYLGALPRETQNYVAKITGNAGDLSGLSNEDKAKRLLPHLVQQESGGDPNAVSPKGATGLTQVMPTTGADPGYGVKPMQNQSKEEQLRFGHDYLLAMLNKYDGDVNKALAAYNAGPGSVDNAIRDNGSVDIASESRALAGQAAKVSSDTQARIDQNQAPGIQAQYTAAMQDNTPRNEVIDKMLKTSYEGVPRSVLEQRLDNIVDQSKVLGKKPINYATAAAILGNVGSRETYGWYNPFHWGTLGETVDNGRLQSELALVGEGARKEGADQTGAAQAISSAVSTAQSDYQTAAANLQKLQAQMRDRPETAKQYPRLKAEYDRAKATLQSALDRASKSSALKPEFNPPGSASNRIAAAAGGGNTGFNSVDDLFKQAGYVGP